MGLKQVQLGLVFLRSLEHLPGVLTVVVIIPRDPSHHEPRQLLRNWHLQYDRAPY